MHIHLGFRLSCISFLGTFVVLELLDCFTGLWSGQVESADCWTRGLSWRKENWWCRVDGFWNRVRLVNLMLAEELNSQHCILLYLDICNLSFDSSNGVQNLAIFLHIVLCILKYQGIMTYELQFLIFKLLTRWQSRLIWVGSSVELAPLQK